MDELDNPLDREVAAQPMGVVDEAIEDGVIRRDRVARHLVRRLNRQLTRDDGGAGPVAVLQECQLLAALDARQWDPS